MSLVGKAQPHRGQNWGAGPVSAFILLHLPYLLPEQSWGSPPQPGVELQPGRVRVWDSPGSPAGQVSSRRPC